MLNRWGRGENKRGCSKDVDGVKIRGADGGYETGDNWKCHQFKCAFLNLNYFAPVFMLMKIYCDEY